jgi:hypothetical protein
MQPAQRLAQPLLGRSLAELGALAQLRQRRPDLALAKAEPSQACKDFALHVEPAGIRGLTVGAAIRVQDTRSFGVALDPQLPAVQCAVVGRANSQQVVHFMLAAGCTRLEMMEVEKGGVLAARHTTTMVIATENGSTECRRNTLFCPSAHVGSRRL